MAEQPLIQLNVLWLLKMFLFPVSDRLQEQIFESVVELTF